MNNSKSALNPVSQNVNRLSSKVHPACGRFYCTYNDLLTGKRKMKYFSRDRVESVQQWRDFDIEQYTSERKQPPKMPDSPPVSPWTIEDMVLVYWKDRLKKFSLVYHLDPDSVEVKKTWKKKDHTLIAVGKELIKHYGDMNISEFGFSTLSKFQEKISCQTVTRNGGEITVKLSHKTINGKINAVKDLFDWAAKQGIGISDIQLDCILKYKLVKENDPSCNRSIKILPIPEELFKRLLPFLSEGIRDMAILQALTGCRAGDVCNMKYCEIVTDMSDKRCKEACITADMAQGAWVFFPTHYKGSERGKENYWYRIGKDEKEILNPYLSDPDRLLDDYVFSPRKSVEIFRNKQRQERKSKVQPSQKDRSKTDSRKPGDHYTTSAYDQGFDRACKKAIEAGAIRQEEIDELFRGQNNQECLRKRNTIKSHMLRKMRLDIIAKKYGMKVAAAVGNHCNQKTTEEHYATDAVKEEKGRLAFFRDEEQKAD